MATIALYATKINQLSGLITNIDKSIGNFGQEWNILSLHHYLTDWVILQK